MEYTWCSCCFVHLPSPESSRYTWRSYYYLGHPHPLESSRFTWCTVVAALVIHHYYLVSGTKKTVIVDVVFVNSVMGAVGWEKSERGKSQGVGQLWPDWGPGWMGIQEARSWPSKKVEVHYYFCTGFDKKRLLVYCVNIKIKYLYVKQIQMRLLCAG